MDNNIIKPAISVLMINRNRDQYLSQAIESVINQTEQNWELIIVDDASSDGSVAIINRWQSDGRIKVKLLNNRQGIGRARRLAVSLAQAPLIGILDSDDVLENNALAVMIEAHQNNPHSLIYSQFLVCGSDLSPIKLGSNGPIPPGSSNLRQNRISHLATFKKNSYEQTTGYNPRLNLAEDKDIFYKLEEIGGTLFIDQVLYRYRTHSASVSNHGWQKILKANLYHLLVRLAAIFRRSKLRLKRIIRPRLIINFTKRLLDKYYFPYLISGAKKKLADLEKTAHTEAEFWQLANSFRFGLPLRGLNLNIRPAQIASEILTLMTRVKELAPQVILEIGTATGGTLYLWTKIAPASSTIISLDLPEGPFGGGYLSARQKIMESFPRLNQTLHLVKSDSHAPSTKETIIKLLAGRPVDFLFIDGDHSYQGVKSDWQDYSPLVRAGGLVALHDIATNPQEPNSRVDRFWAELKKDHHYQEIIADPNQGWAGIGIIKL